MCTLIVAKSVYEGYPLVVAGNRDELLDRPSEVPSLRENGVLAPKDLQRHGSWTGVNDRGMFVGLTNRIDVKSQPGKESRGKLVMDLLSLTNMNEVDDFLPALKGSDYNGFNLLVGDRNLMYMVRGDAQSIKHHRVEGLTIITNHGVYYDGIGANDPQPRRIKNILAAWEAPPVGPPGLLWKAPDFTALKSLLDLHDEWRHGTCINEPAANYGTKSSHIMRLQLNGNAADWEYWHRERSGTGHICGVGAGMWRGYRLAIR